MEFFSEGGGRLDKFLVKHFTKFSRTQLQQFIKDELVRVNGQLVVKPGLILKKGDRLAFEEKRLSSGKDFTIKPEPDIPLEIVYEDKNIAVINKLAGLLVHPTLNQRHHTLVNALVARYPDIIKVGESSLRPGIVHRLDKNTSGLIIVVKNQRAFLFLKNQFLNRQIEKKYLALVEGVPKEKSGVISFQIRPSKKNRLKKVAVKILDTSGKRSVRAAETLYRFRESIGRFSLLEVQPKTGRTHQIRVHLAAIGHPVVGDTMYGARKIKAERQMLHAYFLKFKTLGGKILELSAEIPKDMKDEIEKIRLRRMKSASADEIRQAKSFL